MRRTTVLSVAALAMSQLVVSRRAEAYLVDAKWCNRDNLGSKINSTSFTSKGMTNPGLTQQIRMGAAIWNEAQAGLRFDQPGTTTSTSQADPGPIFADCISGAADVQWSTSPSYQCLSLERMSKWRMRVNSSLNVAGCAPSPFWAWTIADARNPLNLEFLRTVAHEFGHTLSLDDLTSGTMLMNTDSADVWLSNDDIDGVIIGLGEGQDWRKHKTVIGIPNFSTGTMSFGTVANVYPDTDVMWTPAIAADPGCSSGTFDQAHAWVQSTTSGSGAQYQIWVATSRDYSTTEGFYWVTKTNTFETTRNPPGVAVGNGHHIAVAWTGEDLNRTVNFMVSTNGGASFTKTTLWGASAVGGVALAYNPYRGRWIAAWVDALGTPETGTTFRIVTTTSANGTSWSTPVTWNDNLTMPWFKPGIACGSAGSVNNDNCRLIFQTYADSSLGVATEYMSWNPMLETFQPAGGFQNLGFNSYGNPDYARIGNVPPNSGFVISYPAANLTASSSVLTYRMWSDSETSPRPAATLSSAKSRTGFKAAWNYCAGRMRYVWREN